MCGNIQTGLETLSFTSTLSILATHILTTPSCPNATAILTAFARLSATPQCPLWSLHPRTLARLTCRYPTVGTLYLQALVSTTRSRIFESIGESAQNAARGDEFIDLWGFVWRGFRDGQASLLVRVRDLVWRWKLIVWECGGNLDVGVGVGACDGVGGDGFGCASGDYRDVDACVKSVVVGVVQRELEWMQGEIGRLEVFCGCGGSLQDGMQANCNVEKVQDLVLWEDFERQCKCGGQLKSLKRFWRRFFAFILDDQ